MLEYPGENIFVELGGPRIQHAIGISMGTNCAPLVAIICRLVFEFVFIHGLMKADKNVLPNNSILHADKQMMYYLSIIQSLQLLKLTWNKQTSETKANSSYLDLYLYIDNGNLTTRLYAKLQLSHS